jgi:hypothetical protein
MPDDEEPQQGRESSRSSGRARPPARQRPRQGGEPPRLGNPGADPVKVHRQYLEWHIGGGAPPTPELYAQAIEQFRRIPGAIRAPATETPPVDNRAQPDDQPPEQHEGHEQ